MKLHSVNVSLPKSVPNGDETIRTGIFKTPVSGRVILRTTGIDGDGQADLRVHGGPYRAAYVYDIAHYDHWKRELNRDDFAYGQFGENLTVEGLLDDEVCIGDRIRIGETTVEVTHPRVPCLKLGLKMGDPSFPDKFLASGRVGFYLRVLTEGEIGAGDGIEVVHRDPNEVTVWDVCRVRTLEPEDIETARRAIRVEALAPNWKETLQNRVAKADRG
ncbi:MAG: MOSC domain-containing protein [Candidatus Poribacteria bacterium]|nr:MOSC domain-containing protein [Candidatus Poribacteria bacterium]